MLTLTTLYAAVIINGLLLCFLLIFNRRGMPMANQLLAALVFLLVLSMWNLYVDAKGIAPIWKTIDYASWFTPFFWGPALYLYVATITGSFQASYKTIMPHVALGVAMLLTCVILTLFALTYSNNDLLPAFYDVKLITVYVQLLVYGYASYNLLARYSDQLDESSYSRHLPKLTWLQRLIGIFFVVLVIDFVSIMPATFRAQDMPYFSSIKLSEAVAILAIGYLSLFQTGITLKFFANTRVARTKHITSSVATRWPINGKQ